MNADKSKLVLRYAITVEPKQSGNMNNLNVFHSNRMFKSDSFFLFVCLFVCFGLMCGILTNSIQNFGVNLTHKPLQMTIGNTEITSIVMEYSPQVAATHLKLS